jgi:calcineurin-like phosphoesterase family protein
MIWFTSDWHLGHDQEFIYEKRGFSSIREHDEVILENVRKLVRPGDKLYHLGDLCFSNYNETFEKVKGLLFEKVLVIGNHDPSNKLNKIENYKVFDQVLWAHGFKDHNTTYYLSHIPIILDQQNLERKKKIVNIHGHTHSTEKLDNLGHVNVCVDAWQMKPVSFEEIKNLLAERNTASNTL